MNRLSVFIFFYILVCLVGSQVSLIPQVSLGMLGAYLAGLILSPAVGGFVGLIGAFAIGYWQGFPLSVAGHWIVALSVACAAYYFALLYREEGAPAWKRYGLSLVMGYACQVGMSVFLLWCFIGDEALVLWLPWSISAVLSMVVAMAIEYGWPQSLRHYLGAPRAAAKPEGRYRNRKRRARANALAKKRGENTDSSHE